MCCRIDLTITNFQIGSVVESRLVNVDTAAVSSSEVIPSATTRSMLDIPQSPDSKRLRGALLGIKAPGAKIIRKMSRSLFLIFLRLYVFANG